MPTKLSNLQASWPGRERELARLHELIGEPGVALPLFIHGPSGCGKSGVLRAVLDNLDVPTAYLDCVSNPTPQALFDSALNQLANHRPSSSNGYTSWTQSDTVMSFVAGLRRIISKRGRVCLVFDKAERLAQRGGGLLRTLIELPDLCAAAAAAAAASAGNEVDSTAGSVLPIFVGEALWGNFQRVCEGDPRVIHFGFKGYSLEGLTEVLKRDVHAVLPGERNPIRQKLEHQAAAADGGHAGPNSSSGPPAPTAAPHAAPSSSAAPPAGGGAQSVPAPPRAVHHEAFETFVTSFADTFTDVCRDTHELRYLCRQLFPVYLQPAADGEVGLRDTRKLNARVQPHLKRALRSVYSRDGLSHEGSAAVIAAQAGVQQPSDRHVATRGANSINPLGSSVQLPTAAQYLLLAGFLASRLPQRADVALFSSAPRKPGKKGSGPRNAKLSDTPHAFLLERLLAIYASIVPPEPAAIAAAGASGSATTGAGSSSTGAAATAAAASSSFVPTPVLAKPPMRAELLVQVASLVDLRLFSRASKDSQIDTMRLRCEAPKELVQGVATGLGFDLRQYEEE